MGKKTVTFEEVMETRDLTGMDLSGLPLGACDLSGKCFKDADLSHVQLGKSILAGADLRNANLFRANLGAADLTGADLRYADLREANLNGTILLGADVRKTLGLEQPFVIHASTPFQPKNPTESPDFKAAREEGYEEMSHWAKVFSVAGKRIPIFEDIPVWRVLRDQFGEVVFANQETFAHTRLVQQFIDFPRWVYLMTQQGFELMMKTLGYQITECHPDE